MELFRLLALAVVATLSGCASIESNIGKFSDDKYFCSTVRGYQSYLDGYHEELSFEERWGIEELDELQQETYPTLVQDSSDALAQQGVPSELLDGYANESVDHPFIDEEFEDGFEAPHVHGRRFEDNVSDRPIDVTFCLQRGGEKIYFGWSDAKYGEFVWSDTPFSLRLAIDRSCSLQSFPISTRGEYVKDSRIQVPTVRMRSFLIGARQSGETQVPNCPQ